MVVEYANHLADTGQDVTIYLVEFNTVFSLHPEVKIVYVPWRNKAAFILYGAMHHFSCDLLVVDIIHLPLAVGVRNRVVYFAQADDVEYYSGRFGRLMMDMLYRLYFRPVAAVITVDERLASEFARRYRFTDSYTVTNGIDLKTFYPDPDPGLLVDKGERKAVLFMARGDHYRKGFDVAMKVFRQITGGNADAMELWVCGEYLKEADFHFPVKNFGVVTDNRLRQILSSADIFFYPSRHEGFGLFPLEAMACGAVVITTDAVPYARRFDCIRTSAIEDASGLLSSIANLVTDKKMLSELKSDAVRIGRKYDIGLSKINFLKSMTEIAARQK